MPAVREIPDAEKLISDALRDVLDERIVRRIPQTTDDPWVRLIELGADDVTGGAEWLISYMLQLDCYAGERGGQPEAKRLALATRAALAGLKGETLADSAVVSEVSFSGQARVPDPDFHPDRERVVLTAHVWMHNR